MLTREQAAYHFLSGYTALVGSTEVGTNGRRHADLQRVFRRPVLSASRPSVYAELLMRQDQALRRALSTSVNTGWTGGPYGVGRRLSITATRAIVHAVLRGDLNEAATTILPGFNLRIPLQIHGIVDSRILDPRRTWNDRAAYDRNARELIGRFKENFARFDVPAEIAAAGPRV